METGQEKLLFMNSVSPWCKSILSPSTCEDEAAQPARKKFKLFQHMILLGKILLASFEMLN